MKTEYINPFIGGVYTLFETMLGCKVERGNLILGGESNMPSDITAIIGLSGPARGTVGLAFPKETALAVVKKLLSMDDAEAEQNVADGMAEMVNMVAGSAKAKLSGNNGMSLISLGLPTVVRGERVLVDYPRKATWIVVPFESDLGSFHMQVTFEFTQGNNT